MTISLGLGIFPAQALNGRSFVLIAQVSIPLDHLNASPAAQLLNRPQIRARHCKSRQKCASERAERRP